MGGPDSKEAPTVTAAYSNIALFHSNRHQLDEATRYARKSVEVARRFGTADGLLSASLGVYSNAARYSGDLEGALQAIHESRLIAEQAYQPNDSRRAMILAVALWREGLVLGEHENISLNRPKEAEALIQKAFDLSDEMANRDADDYTSRSYVSMTGRELGDLLRDGDPARALEIYDRTRRRLHEIKNNSKARRDEVLLLAGSSYALRSLRRPSESKQRIDAALAILRDLKEYPANRVEPGGEVETVLRSLADHYADTGETTKATTTYETLLAQVRAGNVHPETDLRHATSLSRIYSSFARVRREAGDVAQASALDRQRLDLWHYWDRKLPSNTYVKRQLEF